MATNEKCFVLENDLLRSYFSALSRSRMALSREMSSTRN